MLVQYEADPGLLAARLPPGLKLDRWQGGVYVSLVAFEFLDTRVLGFSFPGCVNFPEVNLRFYVTDGERRGVCFVRELVPQRLTSWVARWRYNEPYARAAMRVRSSEESGTLTIEHRFAAGGGEHRV